MNQLEKSKENIKKIRIFILFLLFLTSIPAGFLFYGYIFQKNLMLYISLSITIFLLLLSVILTFLINRYENKLDEKSLLRKNNEYTKIFFNLENGIELENKVLPLTIYYLKTDDRYLYLKNKVDEVFKVKIKDIKNVDLREENGISFLEINLKNSLKIILKVSNSLENILKNEIFNNIIYNFKINNLLKNDII